MVSYKIWNYLLMFFNQQFHIIIINVNTMLIQKGLSKKRLIIFPLTKKDESFLVPYKN